MILFKAESLQCQVFLNPNHMQSLHIKVQQMPLNMPDGKQPFQWNLDDLHVIEKFFDTRVVSPPYRPNALWGFGRMLNVPPPVLRDFIQVTNIAPIQYILLSAYIFFSDYPFRIDARFITRTQVARSILYAFTAVCSSSRTNSRRHDSLENPFLCKRLSPSLTHR